MENLININDLNNSEIEYLDEIIPLSEEAKSFLMKTESGTIINWWLERGWWYIINVYLFELENSNYIWVIVWDLPSMLISFDEAKIELKL